MVQSERIVPLPNVHNVYDQNGSLISMSKTFEMHLYRLKKNILIFLCISLIFFNFKLLSMITAFNCNFVAMGVNEDCFTYFTISNYKPKVIN